MGGKAIRQWAAELYNRIVEVKRIHPQVALTNPTNTVIASHPSITANDSNETTKSKEDASKEKKYTFVKPRSAITIFSHTSNETTKHSLDEVTAGKITTKETT